MPDPNADRRPSSDPTHIRIAITACLGVIAILLGILVVRSFTGDDTGGRTDVVKIDEKPDGLAGDPDADDAEFDEMTGDASRRAGDPDVAEMLDTVIREADGTTTSLRDELSGRPVLVNLWSRTCVPCIREMPWFEAVNVSDDRVEVIGVNQQDQLGAAQELAEETAITYRWFLDGAGDLLYHGRGVGLPDTYLFDENGSLLGSKLGVFADEAELRNWLDEHLS